MTSPEQAFQQAMIDLYARTKRETGYDAHWFLQMIALEGGVGAAQRLVTSLEPASGFTTLWEMNRLDLTVESVILEPRWAALFSQEVLTAARDRLRQYGAAV